MRAVLERVSQGALVCGSRRWPWPHAVEAVFDRLTVLYGQDLVVIHPR